MYIKLVHILERAVILFVFSTGLAVGLGIGALAEVAKKSMRHNGAAGKTQTHTHKKHIEVLRLSRNVWDTELMFHAMSCSGQCQ